MNRISIEVTPEQHQRLQALAAVQGQSIEQFILDRTLGTGTATDTDTAELEGLLDQRHREALASVRSSRSVSDIFQDARRELAGGKPKNSSSPPPKQ